LATNEFANGQIYFKDPETEIEGNVIPEK